MGGVPVLVVQSSLVNTITLYLGSKWYADLITSTLILNMGPIAEAAPIYCYDHDWDEGKTNFPEAVRRDPCLNM
jgi:hypothetical protein